MLKISVRNYRGIEQAEVNLDPIALVCGLNEVGKSSLAEAARCVLTGQALVVPGISKKDAKLLVRDGTAIASAVATLDDSTNTVTWPQCAVTTANEIQCSNIAAGLSHPFDLKGPERAALLAKYLKSAPTRVQLAEAATAVGYSDASVNKLVERIEQLGWAEVYDKSADYGKKLKGQWSEVTRENYGAKKAETWQHPDLVANVDRETLEANVAKAKQAVLDAAGRAAVSDDEIKRLWGAVGAMREAETKADPAFTLEGLRVQLADKQAERAALPTDAESGNEQAPCPECGCLLTIKKVWKEPTQLVSYNPDEAEVAAKHDSRIRAASLDGDCERLKAEIRKVEAQVQARQIAITAGKTAAARLDEIKSQPETDESAAAEAQEAEKKAIAALAALDSTTRAAEIHASIALNAELLKVLAPDGLRKTVLEKVLAGFNRDLTKLASRAGWFRVHLDDDLEPHYAERPLWAASRSGKWRARTMMQIALAKIDKSVAVVIDDADCLIDGRSRNGLLNLLNDSGLRALVCMAVAKRELVPNLKTVGMGECYWVDGAMTEAIQ